MEGPVPAVYVKHVQREMPRVELLLKIIASPRERFGDTIRALWSEASLAELSRVMELKSMTKKEQSDVLVGLGLMKQPTGSSLVAGFTGSLGALGGGSAPAPAPAPATGGAGGAGGATTSTSSSAMASGLASVKGLFGKKK